MINELSLDAKGDKKMSTIRVRIAPSPTGPFHVGTARTALFNYLFAQKHGGAFIVRIEDTDAERSSPLYEADILESLRWLGLRWDEGPILNIETEKQRSGERYIGDYGPYRQSERTEIYRPYIRKLLDEEKAYWCFHTNEEVEAIHRDQDARGEPQRYPGYCRHLTEKEQKANIRAGKPAIIRFAVPEGRTIVFDDLVMGRIEFDSSLFGDFSIAKGEDMPLYNLAAPIDDYTMGITHVIRGGDHISNTPRQILIEEALEFPMPYFAHVPLILGADRQKLSKRHGATSVHEYRKAGYIPESLVNFMALLGWSAQGKEEKGGTNQDIFSVEELVEHFSLEKVQRSNAIFNIVKLDSLNAVHMRKLPLSELTRRSIPFLEKAGLIYAIKKYAQVEDDIYRAGDTDEEVSFDWITGVVALERERVKRLSDIADATEFFFKITIEYPKELLRWRDMSDEEVREALTRVEKALAGIPEGEWHENLITQKIKDIAQGDNGRYFWPFRVALSGREKSPGPQEIAGVLGREKTLLRIKHAKNLLE